MCILSRRPKPRRESLRDAARSDRAILRRRVLGVLFALEAELGERFERSEDVEAGGVRREFADGPEHVVGDAPFARPSVPFLTAGLRTQ